MPPKKRKIEVVHFEHPYVTVGTSNIRGRKRGKQIADKDIRNNVLMFLENLKDEEAKNYSQSVFQGKLSSAVSGALDPVEGPEAYIGLSEYHPDFPKIFGNKAAGQLMGMLLGSLDLDHDGSVAELQQACDKMKTGLEREEKDRKRVENTLSWLQELIPVDDSPGSGKRTLSTELEALDQPVGDAAWLYAILWASCLRWMDSRLRQLHKFGAHNNTKLASQPGGMSDRLMMINARLHGGDLRTDALMCHISFGDHRQDDFHYDQYIKDCFKNAYNLSIHDGLWLARHGHGIRGGVDWPHVIGFIDKFATMSDRVRTWLKQPAPPNFRTVVNDRFVPLTKHVSAIIKKAGQNPDWDTWNADAADLTTLANLQDDLKNECQTWKKRGDSLPLWDAIGYEQAPWVHAGYLRDVRTKQQIVVS